MSVAPGTRFGPYEIVAAIGAGPSTSPHMHACIAYWGLGENNERDIWTVASDGSEADAPRKVTNDAAVDWSPAWSPDGRHLYFSTETPGQEFLAYSWSPDGQWLAGSARVQWGTRDGIVIVDALSVSSCGQQVSGCERPRGPLAAQ